MTGPGRGWAHILRAVGPWGVQLTGGRRGLPISSAVQPECHEPPSGSVLSRVESPGANNRDGDLPGSGRATRVPSRRGQLVIYAAWPRDRWTTNRYNENYQAALSAASPLVASQSTASHGHGD